MKYVTTLDQLSPAKLVGFFEGWPNPPSPEMHLTLLKNSYKVVLAIDETTKQVVGFITAISDGLLSAYIPLLEVLPTYKNQGIGQELVKQMIQQLNDLYMVDLLCDPDLQPYYEKFGMTRSQGMVIRNYTNQSGRR